MREFDQLPAELRAWLASAALPWRPRSVHRAFCNALRRTNDKKLALRELDALQQRRLAEDATGVWGHDYPDAAA